MKDKCNICDNYVKNANLDDFCIFATNGCEDICPFDNRLVNLLYHDIEIINKTKMLFFEKEKTYGND